MRYEIEFCAEARDNISAEDEEQLIDKCLDLRTGVYRLLYIWPQLEDDELPQLFYFNRLGGRFSPPCNDWPVAIEAAEFCNMLLDERERN